MIPLHWSLPAFIPCRNARAVHKILYGPCSFTLSDLTDAHHHILTEGGNWLYLQHLMGIGPHRIQARSVVVIVDSF